MLKTRLLTAAVAVPALLGIIFSGCPVLFVLLILAANLLGQIEFYRMTLPGEGKEGWLVGLGVGALLIVGSRGGRPATMEAILAAGLFLLFAHALFSPGEIPSRVKRLFGVACGVLYISFPLSFLTPLWAAPGGARMIVFFLAVCMLSDTGQFLAGRRFGRRKLYPSVSPNKTWEGALGGVVAGIAAGFVANAVLDTQIAWVQCAILSSGMVVVGIIGDLFESLLKRGCGVKDSGSIFPGHGGMLDRLDSLLFAGPFLWFWLHSGMGV